MARKRSSRRPKLIPKDTAEAAAFIQAHKNSIDRHFGGPQLWEDDATTVVRHTGGQMLSTPKPRKK